MVQSTYLHLFLGLFLVPPSFAAIYTSRSQLPRSTYDYIVVGGGTAGNVIASRLSENASNKVLVIEAGGSNEGVLPIQVPFLGPTLAPNTPFDWNYTVTPQEGLNGRTFPFPRGRVLGGSSSINYMVHQYGSSEDYDKLAALTGDSGWSWDNMKQYITRHEKFVPPADGHDTTGQYTPSLHSTTGALPKSLPGFSFGVDGRVIATTQELSAEFPYNQDMGGGDVLGLGWVQSSIGGGVRSSSASTYLEAAKNRPNLDVLVGHQVTKLLPIGFSGGKLSFRGVQFASGPQGQLHSDVKASKEVVLCAGSIGTPQILLLSGIGDLFDLAHKAVFPLVNLPSVGKNLSDHVLLPNVFSVQGTESLDSLLRDGNAFNAALNQWQSSKTGVLANGVVNQLGFLRLPSSLPIFSQVPDPASGPKASHWEMIFANYWLHPSRPLPATGSFFTIISALISPTSRGSVKLRTNNAFDAPLIDPKLVTTEFDKVCLREAVKATKRFMAADAWDGYVNGPALAGLGSNVDSEIDAYVRAESSTVYHPVGTASMSPANANWGVVDPQLRVKGTHGLRVVDASVWPFVPNAHTQGPVYLVAERAATLF
ncbi:hypothetical protein BKA70DRAFT_1198967 [Coprinopsis sp. MPI-PUGE-AT-0042]|nr:hypothetical protein BKA70DRAFT_1198967 [Coprinopsis sp. MPI-PUGE-AT-0042]